MNYPLHLTRMAGHLPHWIRFKYICVGWQYFNRKTNSNSDLSSSVVRKHYWCALLGIRFKIEGTPHPYQPLKDRLCWDERASHEMKCKGGVGSNVERLHGRAHSGTSPHTNSYESHFDRLCLNCRILCGFHHFLVIVCQCK